MPQAVLPWNETKPRGAQAAGLLISAYAERQAPIRTMLGGAGDRTSKHRLERSYDGRCFGGRHSRDQGRGLTLCYVYRIVIVIFKHVPEKRVVDLLANI